MATIIMGYIGVTKGLYRDNGKEDGNYYNALYRDYYKDPSLSKP